MCQLNWQSTVIRFFFFLSKVQIMFWSWEGMGVISPTQVINFR